MFATETLVIELGQRVLMIYCADCSRAWYALNTPQGNADLLTAVYKHQHIAPCRQMAAAA
jgi:hypothetical protein